MIDFDKCQWQGTLTLVVIEEGVEGDTIVINFQFHETLKPLPYNLEAIKHGLDCLAWILTSREESEYGNLVDKRKGHILRVC